MSDLIGGFIGVTLVVLFLGGLAIAIGSIPFYIIVLVILGFAITDYVQTIKNKNGEQNRPSDKG